MVDSVRVELVGMLPDLFRLCPKATDACAIEHAAEQMREYPPEVQANQERIAEIYGRLLADFGGRAVPVSVSYMSPRGFWLSLRHRLSQRTAVAVVGARVIPLEAGYEPLRQAVAAALGQP